MGEGIGERAGESAEWGRRHVMVVIVAVALPCFACGPAVDLDRGTGPETGTGTGSSDATVTTTTVDLDSTTVGVTSDEPPKLDVAPFDLPPSSIDLPMYEACGSDEVCAAGLECITIAYGKLIQYSICTAPCFDPTVDCDAAPEGWLPVCALDLGDGRGEYCAIGCNAGFECPRDTSCHELFIRDEPPQQTCLPW